MTSKPYHLLLITKNLINANNYYRGTTSTLKLSPNLRLKCKPPKKQLVLDQHALQIMKLERLLSLVREMPEGEAVKDDEQEEIASN